MLENPIWNALSTRHSDLAIEHGLARRYPPEVAPFASVLEPTPAAERDLLALVKPGERVGLLSVMPDLSDAWSPAYAIQIHQFIWKSGASASPDPRAVKLGEEHLDAMLELTALTYPAYFRPGTARLGDYFGIFDEGRLVAMAGIRMAMDGFQELSAICTHPEARGKGLAGALTQHLAHWIVSQGDVPFLHTESDNAAAQSVYHRVGFELRAVLPFQVVDRL